MKVHEDTITVESIGLLGFFPQLRQLHLHHVPRSGLSVLSTLTGLESLRSSWSAGAEELSSISALANSTRLELWNINWVETPERLSSLSCLQALQVLSIPCDIEIYGDDQHLESLLDLVCATTLEELELSWMAALPGSCVEHMPCFADLKLLRMNGRPGFEDKDLTPLRRLAKLTCLDLIECQNLSPKALNLVRPCPNLAALNLAENEWVSNSALKSLEISVGLLHWGYTSAVRCCNALYRPSLADSG